MQGWDSVVVKSDIELGGTDQKYNLLVGRDLQRDEGQEPQICITMPLLVGTDGKQKMSKSYDNYIGVTEPAKTMFDKIVSIPDAVVRDYATLLTDVGLDEFSRLLESSPVRAKGEIAADIVARYYGEPAGSALLESYRQTYVQKERFSQALREAGQRVKEQVLKEGERRKALRETGSALAEADLAQKAVISAKDLKDGKIWIVRLVKATGFVKSNSQARQKIIEGAVTLNGEKITDPDAELSVKDGDVIKLGKKRLAVVKLQ
jgi:tyrosyl-tRNA synthetase